MTIAKYIRRDHAYVGQTFSSTRRLGRGRQDCILQGGIVSESDPFGVVASEVTIAPFILELGGLVIHSDADEVIPYTQPTNPGDSMFLVVSSPDDTDASGLVWTVITRKVDYTAGFIFAVRRNVGSGAVWAHTPVGSLRAILDRIENPLEHSSERASHIDAERFRPSLQSVGSSTVVRVEGPQSGLLTSALGASMGFDSGGFVLAAAHHSYARRDRLVLRRGEFGPRGRYGMASYGGVDPTKDDAAEGPLDRFAYIDVIPGVPRKSSISDPATAFGQNDHVAAAAAAIATGRKLGADVNRHVSARDGTYTRATGYNDLYVAYQTAADDLRSVRMSADRTTVPAGTNIAAAAAGRVRTDINMVILPTGESVILYTYTGGAGGQKLYMSKVNADGLAFSATVDLLVFDAAAVGGIGGAADNIHRPKGFVDQDGSIQIVMEAELSPGGAGANGAGEALYWMKISAAGSVLSQPIRLTDFASGTTATPAYELQGAEYVDGELLVTAIRRADQTVSGDLPDAHYLSFSDALVVTEKTMNLATSVASVQSNTRSLDVGAFAATEAIATTVAAAGPRVAAIFSNADTGDVRRYVHYGTPGAPELSNFLKRNDGQSVSSVSLLPHSNQLGDPSSSLTLSQSSEQIVAVHDGTAVHLVGWDAVSSELVYERLAAHSLNGLPFSGDITTRFNLLDIAGTANTAIPSDLLMVRAASGEVLIVRITATGADAGAVVVTEVTGVEGEPDPVTPDVTVLAEFDVQGGATSATSPPAMLESSRVTRPARDLVVGGGGPGGLVGSAGLRLALETLRGTGGTIRVRAGFYDIFQPIALTSGVEVKCDPGAVFRSRSTAGMGAINVEGATASVSSVDALGTATISAPGQHLRTLGFTAGCILREVATGDEYYITEVLEEHDKIRVDDASMPTGNYDLLQTGVTWLGGTFIGDFAVGVRLHRAARVSIHGCHFKTGTTGSPPLFAIGGCSDVDVRRIYGDLGANGTLFPTSASLQIPSSRRISVRESRFINGADIGLVYGADGFDLVDVAFTGNTLNILVYWDSGGQVDKVRIDTDQGHLTTMGSSRVVIGDTDFGFQNDASRSGPFNDTLNKPTFTDAWFRGNVYVSGFLNHGQYDLAIMALAMAALDEELFQLFGMVDGITETFQTFGDVENNAFYAVPSTSVAGRWYPDPAPLVLGGVGGITPPVATVGLRDRVAPDNVFDGFVEVVPMGHLFLTTSGGLRGRHSSVRGVIHHDAHPAGGTDPQDGYPDRGKIEFQSSWSIGGAEGTALVGEADSYSLLTQNLGSDPGGSNGQDLAFTSRRYDLDTGILVGSLGTSGGKKKWQRTYAAHTHLAANRIAVVSTEVNTSVPLFVGVTPSVPGWSLRLRVDLFNATTGELLGGSAPHVNGGGIYADDWVVHVAAASLEQYGELAEVKLVPDLTTPSQVWLVACGRFFNNDTTTPFWDAATRLAKIDMAAGTFDPGTLFIDVDGAGNKFKDLQTVSSPLAYCRGLSVVPIIDPFSGSPIDSNNYLVSVMRNSSSLAADGAADWRLWTLVLQSDGSRDFAAVPVTPVTEFTNSYIPCAMASENEKGGMINLGTLQSGLTLGDSWPWSPLSGGSYIDVDARATFIVASSPTRETWVGSTITAVHLTWTGAAASNAPDAATVTAYGSTVGLSQFPGAIWDGPARRFLIPYVEGNAYPGHTQDRVRTIATAWASPWAWTAPVDRRGAFSSPLVRNLVSASLADQGDASASQRLNVAWQGQDGGDATLWAGLQMNTSSVVTAGAWYDSANPEMNDALNYVLNMARYWMADAQWDASARLAAPATSDTLDREHFMLYHVPSVNPSSAKPVRLRCVGRQLAVKVEMDVPWADNLVSLTMRIRGGGETNGAAAAAVTGLAGFPQVGFRDGANSMTLSNADAAPTHDDYNGTAPLFVATTDGYPALAAWTTVALSGTPDNLSVAANVAQRPIVTVSAPHASFAYAAGDRIIKLETASGFMAGLAPRDLLTLMVGMTVVLTGAPGPGGATEHRITYFGVDSAGLYNMVIEPPVAFASHGTPSSNLYTFKKRVTGAVFVPPAGFASIVHPERVWINQLELEASRAPELVGSSVDTSVNPAIVPPASCIVIMSLIDTEGVLAADLASSGLVDLTDYLTLYLTRNNGAAPEDWTQATVVDLTPGGPNPLQQTAMGDGSTVFAVFAQIAWPIGPYSYNEVGYKVVWNSTGGFPGKTLHIDRIVMGWN